MLTFCKVTWHNHLTHVHSQTFTMYPIVLACLPNSKANPPSAHGIKPTEQMATYVATPGDFDALLTQSKMLFFLSNTLLSMLRCLTLPLTLEHKQWSFQKELWACSNPRSAQANSPDSWARVRRHFTLSQERLQSSNTSAIYDSATPNEHESTKIGCSHSLS